MFHISTTHAELTSQPEYNVSLFCFLNLYCQIQKFCYCVTETCTGLPNSKFSFYLTLKNNLQPENKQNQQKAHFHSR